MYSAQTERTHLVLQEAEEIEELAQPGGLAEQPVRQLSVQEARAFPD